MLSTCLLLWSLSSLFITHKLFKSNVRSEEEAETVKLVSCDDSQHISDRAVRKRQVVQGWFDFQGELLHVGEIDPEGSTDFSSDNTELDMEIGLGRHDRSFTSMIYDRVNTISCGDISVLVLLKGLAKRFVTTDRPIVIVVYLCNIIITDPVSWEYGELLLMITNDCWP